LVRVEELGDRRNGVHVQCQLRKQLEDIDMITVNTVAAEAINKIFHLMAEHMTRCTQVFTSKCRSAETTTVCVIDWITARG